MLSTQDFRRSHKLVNSFDKNLQLTVLDFYESRFIGRTLNLNFSYFFYYTSFLPWRHRTAWISTSVRRALEFVRAINCHKS